MCERHVKMIGDCIKQMDKKDRQIKALKNAIRKLHRKHKERKIIDGYQLFS